MEAMVSISLCSPNERACWDSTSLLQARVIISNISLHVSNEIISNRSVIVCDRCFQRRASSVVQHYPKEDHNFMFKK